MNYRHPPLDRLVPWTSSFLQHTWWKAKQKDIIYRFIGILGEYCTANSFPTTPEAPNLTLPANPRQQFIHNSPGNRKLSLRFCASTLNAHRVVNICNFWVSVLNFKDRLTQLAVGLFFCWNIYFEVVPHSFIRFGSTNFLSSSFEASGCGRF